MDAKVLFCLIAFVVFTTFTPRASSQSCIFRSCPDGKCCDGLLFGTCRSNLTEGDRCNIFSRCLCPDGMMCRLNHQRHRTCVSSNTTITTTAATTTAATTTTSGS